MSKKQPVFETLSYPYEHNRTKQWGRTESGVVYCAYWFEPLALWVVNDHKSKKLHLFQTIEQLEHNFMKNL